MELDRRHFLKGAFATGAVAAAGAALAGCAPSAAGEKPESGVTEAGTPYPERLQASDFEDSPVELDPITKFSEEKTYDVVVVGAGTFRA